MTLKMGGGFGAASLGKAFERGGLIGIFQRLTPRARAPSLRRGRLAKRGERDEHVGRDAAALLGERRLADDGHALFWLFRVLR